MGTPGFGNLGGVTLNGSSSNSGCANTGGLESVFGLLAVASGSLITLSINSSFNNSHDAGYENILSVLFGGK